MARNKTAAAPPARWPEAMTDKVLAEYLSTSVRAVWQLAATHRIPEPVKLTNGCSRWLKSKVDQRLEELATA